MSLRTGELWECLSDIIIASIDPRREIKLSCTQNNAWPPDQTTINDPTTQFQCFFFETTTLYNLDSNITESIPDAIRDRVPDQIRYKLLRWAGKNMCRNITATINMTKRKRGEAWAKKLDILTHHANIAAIRSWYISVGLIEADWLFVPGNPALPVASFMCLLNFEISFANSKQYICTQFLEYYPCVCA
jgi:hypothetical protein